MEIGVAKKKQQSNKQTIKGQSVTQAEAPPGGSPLSSSNWETEGGGERSSYIQRWDYPHSPPHYTLSFTAQQPVY